MVKIAVDVDGTLIHAEGGAGTPNTPRHETIWLMTMLSAFCEDVKLYVWSGGGIEYAQNWVNKLGLDSLDIEVVAKGSFEPDIVIDDCEVNLGKVNLKIS